MDGCLRVQLPALTRVALSRLISIGPAVAVAIWTEAQVQREGDGGRWREMGGDVGRYTEI